METRRAKVILVVELGLMLLAAGGLIGLLLVMAAAATPHTCGGG